MRLIAFLVIQAILGALMYTGAVLVKGDDLTAKEVLGIVLFIVCNGIAEGVRL